MNSSSYQKESEAAYCSSMKKPVTVPEYRRSDGTTVSAHVKDVPVKAKPYPAAKPKHFGKMSDVERRVIDRINGIRHLASAKSIDFAVGFSHGLDDMSNSFDSSARHREAVELMQTMPEEWSGREEEGYLNGIYVAVNSYGYEHALYKQGCSEADQKEAEQWNRMVLEALQFVRQDLLSLGDETEMDEIAETEAVRLKVIEGGLKRLNLDLEDNEHSSIVGAKEDAVLNVINYLINPKHKVDGRVRGDCARHIGGFYLSL